MTAILTRFIGPTNTKPGRIVIEAGDRPHAYISRHKWETLEGEALHRAAAEEYAARMGWTGRLVGGGTRDGYAFVFAP